MSSEQYRFHFGRGPVSLLMAQQGLHAVFQPIVNLSDGSVHAHEALIRGPAGHPLERPDALLQQAQAEGRLQALEWHCLDVAVATWGSLAPTARLFVNISADALLGLLQRHGSQTARRLLGASGLPARLLTLEITEYQRVQDVDQLVQQVQPLRHSGVQLALDDFGDGHSSLRLWSQLQPDLVKIDKFFCQQLSQRADKVKTLQALQQIATTFGTQLVVEGVESLQDLRLLRDLELPLGQGYALGRPQAQPHGAALPDAVAVLQDKTVAVMPELRRAGGRGVLQRMAVVRAPTVEPHTPNDRVAQLFHQHPDLHALAVVQGQRPVGIINRVHFFNEYSKLYYREIWGQRPCSHLANPNPRLVERHHQVDELVGILTSEDQRYLSDGFIVVEDGRYQGLGTGEQLVRCVTETRIEAARHANPLTFLPGNIPISQHIARLLASGARFVACYADLNHFKPFNDRYGYWRGDEMIRLLARLAQGQCDPQRDFLGHVGGDDFILLFQSADWEERCRALIDAFGQQAPALFDEQARHDGGIEAEDRYGFTRFFPLTTLAIGALVVDVTHLTQPEQVASLAAQVKHQAKSSADGLAVMAASALTEPLPGPPPQPEPIPEETTP